MIRTEGDLSKKLLYQNNKIGPYLVLLILFLFPNLILAQANLVGNPGFDSTCSGIYPPYWHGLDSAKCCEIGIYSTCNGGVPKNGQTYQWPKSGKGYYLTTAFCNGCMRCYLVNRLKKALDPGVVYCAKYYINICNESKVGCNGFGAYFANNLFDTVKCANNSVLSFVTPQINNNTVIYDTLNWTAIQGTFTANGSEKYMVLGNFRSDAATNTIAIMSSTWVTVGTDIGVEDASCIPIDLPAYGGPDKPFFGGDSVFIGRTPDVGLNEYCIWFQLPNMSAPIATVAGLYVKPISTTTYVVRQQLWCSGVKWDTVVVYKNQVGLEENRFLNNTRIFPNPTSNQFTLELPMSPLNDPKIIVQIYDCVGRLVSDEVIIEGHQKHVISTVKLAEGVYQVKLTINGVSGIKSLVIQR